MTKFIPLYFASVLLSIACQSQIVTNTARAQLETSSAAMFGGQVGTSAFFNTVGFNLYNAGGNLRSMGSGYSGFITFNSSTPYFDFTIYPSTVANTILSAGAVTGLRLGSPTGTKILTSANHPNAVLDVGRGTSFNGTAVFHGSSFTSHFNYSTDEHTYIRGGKPGSRVILNDVSNSGSTRIGSASTIVGVNYNNPVYTFEVRQAGGLGLKLSTSGTGNWEWRVAGNPANFYMLWNGTAKGYFNPAGGTYHQLSDERLKKDIEELPPVLGTVMKLNPVDYVMKEGNPNRIRTIGFVAQEVQSVFPQLVFSRQNGTQFSLQYSGFAPIAVKAIQEQQELIDAEYKSQQEAMQLIQKIEARLNKKDN